MDDNALYYRRRAEEELDAAENALDPAISQIHRDMARRYREMCEDGPRAMNGAGPLPKARAPAPEPGTLVG
ncbi:MAG TPA: hypothetical protein VNJ05_07465 [Sphingomicrobium sp.]|nr:hypothetical protein [Sphingomicrobium sp.]